MKWEDLHNGNIKLQCGDIGFSRGAGTFGKIIRWATAGKVNHTIGITCELAGNDYNITEALSRVVERSIYNYEGKGKELVIFRNRGLFLNEQKRLVSSVRKKIGIFYSPFRIVTQFIDKMIGKVIRRDVDLFDRLVTFPWTTICSTLWAEAYQSIGISFGEDGESADPEEMFDWCSTHPELWKMIFVTDGF